MKEATIVGGMGNLKDNEGCFQRYMLQNILRWRMLKMQMKFSSSMPTLRTNKRI